MGEQIYKITPPEKTENYILSIRLRNDGCYFAISDPTTNNSYKGQNIVFPPTGNTPLQSIEEAVYNQPVLLKTVLPTIQTKSFAMNGKGISYIICSV